REKSNAPEGVPTKKMTTLISNRKTGPHVRKTLGYLRYDSPTALEAINDLYQKELGSMMNLFQPSVKLVEKKQVGSRLKEPMTCRRLHWIGLRHGRSLIPTSTKN